MTWSSWPFSSSVVLLLCNTNCCPWLGGWNMCCSLKQPCPYGQKWRDSPQLNSGLVSNVSALSPSALASAFSSDSSFEGASLFPTTPVAATEITFTPYTRLLLRLREALSVGPQKAFRSSVIHWSTLISGMLSEVEADVGVKQLHERWEIL